MDATHLDAVIAIERSAYEFPWSEANFRDALCAGYSSWVLVDGIDANANTNSNVASVLGYVLISMAAGEGQILNLCVSPAWRRQGLARCLLDHLLAVARSAGLEDLFLEVRRSNLAAIGLYRAYGFESVGVRRNYYRAAAAGSEDALVFSLKLGVAANLATQR